MVLSTAPLAVGSYLTGRKFLMPMGEETILAIAVNAEFASRLNSAYTMLVTTMVVNTWCILFAVALAVLLRINQGRPHFLSTSLWNKRSSMLDSFFELASSTKDQWKKWWTYPVILAILACWTSQIALSIYIPSNTLIDHAAPVNPESIFVPRFVPTNKNSSDSDVAALFALDAQSVLRAAGMAQVVPPRASSRINVSKDPDVLETGQAISTVRYSYHVTGTDFGLQNHPTLTLKVSGVCRTEYKWLLSSEIFEAANGSSRYYQDTYAIFGNKADPISLSIFQGNAPVAFFKMGPKPDHSQSSNSSWAAFVSSVDRKSYHQSNDPLYETQQVQGSKFNTVKPQRPVLLCWETNDWTFDGHTSSILGLNSTKLPGLDLPKSLSNIFVRYLSIPMVVTVGNHLGATALQSSLVPLGPTFPADTSTMYDDLRRLVLIAFIATTNVLTDTTLYPLTSSIADSSKNLARGPENQPLDRIGEFVVWTDEVATLSIAAVITIPVLSIVLAALVFVVLTWTPVRSVTALDAVSLHKALLEQCPEARPFKEGVWRRDGVLDEEAAMPLTRRGMKRLASEAETIDEIGEVEVVNEGEQEEGAASVTSERPHGAAAGTRESVLIPPR